MSGPRASLLGFRANVDDVIDAITEFVKRVVIHRREFAIQGWENWVLEDPLVHPYQWLRTDLVPLAPLLSCAP